MLLIAGGAGAQAGLTQAVLDDVAAEPRSDAALPLGLRFSDENGQPRTLGDVLAGQPAIPVFADYPSPPLCGPALTFVPARPARSGPPARPHSGPVAVRPHPHASPTNPPPP